MPRLAPVVAVVVIALAAIWLLFPDYLALQGAPTAEQFRGTLGDDTARASSAAVADLVFTTAYCSALVIAFARVAEGVPRWIGTVASVVGALADQAENVMVLLNVRSASSVDQDAVDLMTTFGAIKYGALVVAVVLLLALVGQQWLERRRG